MNSPIKAALVIVDVQNDFCPGGSLPVPHGDEVVGPLNDMIALAQRLGMIVVASRDWHPAETSHFAPFGGVWPVHCVQDTEGAAFHQDLQLPANVRIFSKGTQEDEDAYSAFQGREESGDNNQPGLSLADMLEAEGIWIVYVGGLATDYCVKATALDSAKKGFITFLITDACRAVDINSGDGDRAIEEMREAMIMPRTTKGIIDKINAMQ